jgi:hypothetical protein
MAGSDPREPDPAEHSAEGQPQPPEQRRLFDVDEPRHGGVLQEILPAQDRVIWLKPER